MPRIPDRPATRAMDPAEGSPEIIQRELNRTAKSANGKAKPARKSPKAKTKPH